MRARRWTKRYPDLPRIPARPLWRDIQPGIDRVFAEESVEAIRGALEKEPGDWAREARQAMDRASPISLKITLRQLQLGQGMSVEQALTLEYRMTQHIMAGHDFFEGIRAVVVEKDNKPRWQHARLEDVERTGSRKLLREPGRARTDFRLAA